jgi:Terminase RNaseH-like domain/Terminase large subunit, T4likevirus-type, N-terminal
MPSAPEVPPRVLNKRAFFDDLEYEPHPGQWHVHESTASRRVVACGVRWGKTLCAAMEGLAAAMAPGERSIGWVVAPTYDLADRVFREIQLIAVQHLRHRIVTMRDSDRRLVLRNMAGGTSEIRAKSADNPVSLLGEGLNWLIVDEASRLKPSIWQSHLTQRLIDKRGWALLISTPRGKGYFYDLWKRGQDRDAEFASWNYPTWTNPLLDKELVEAERARLPERVFRQEYGAEFLEGSGSVFRYVREAATGEWLRPVEATTYSAGLDLAKVEDFTVFAVLNRDKQLVAVDRFHRLDWALQVQRIKAAADRYGRARMICDSTGAGEPIYESLCAAGCRAEAYPFTQASKAALINNLALLLEQRKLVLPRPELWPEGIDELESFEYAVTDQGNVRTGAPSGAHDDCVIALALAAWHFRPDARNAPAKIETW